MGGGRVVAAAPTLKSMKINHLTTTPTLPDPATATIMLVAVVVSNPV